MISAALIALASLSAPVATPVAAVPASAAYASDTVAHLKGHPAVARPAKAQRSAAPACHPDVSKGRACRHHVAQARQATEASATAVAVAATNARID